MNKSDLAFFENRLSSGFYFPLGFSLRKKQNEPYGISLNPNILITNISSDYIPDMIKTDLKALIKKPDYYIGNGIFKPPIWFVNVKVERIKRERGIRDIRSK